MYKMTTLTSALHPNLTLYVIKLLNSNKIFTVIEFLRETSATLCKITNLTLKEVLAVRKHLLKEHGVGSVTGVKLYQNLDSHFQMIPTGIKSVDELIGGGLSIGNILEICGLPASGKTQFCSTVAMNVAHGLHFETLYIDTKHDFSAIRIRNMLRSRNCLENDIGHTMQRIRVKRVYSVELLIDLLKELLSMKTSWEQLKIIIIDSLPALWFMYSGDAKFEGISLLTETAILLRKLANKFKAAIVVVNLVASFFDATLEEIETRKSQILKPSLGKYWQSVPSVRLLIEEKESISPLNISMNSALYNLANPNDTSGDGDAAAPNTITSHQVKVVKSDFNESGKCCPVFLTQSGVAAEK